MAMEMLDKHRLLLTENRLGHIPICKNPNPLEDYKFIMLFVNETKSFYCNFMCVETSVNAVPFSIKAFAFWQSVRDSHF